MIEYEEIEIQIPLLEDYDFVSEVEARLYCEELDMGILK